MFVTAPLLESIRASAITNHTDTHTHTNSDTPTVFFFQIAPPVLHLLGSSSHTTLPPSLPPSQCPEIIDTLQLARLLNKQHTAQKEAASAARAAFGHMCSDTFKVLLISQAICSRSLSG